MTTRGCNRHLCLAMLAGLAAVGEARAQAPDSGQMPTFVDASRRGDLRAAWTAANTKADTQTSRTRAEALSSRFATEPQAPPAPAAPPAVVAPTETAAIEKPPAPPAPPPSVKTPQKPAASPMAAPADDDAKRKATKRRKRIKRVAKQPKPQPTVRVATSKEDPPLEPGQDGALGPAGRLPTDYERWHLFPAAPESD